ncbi:MAG: RNA ligase family protein [Pseudomonadota bacterium]
MSTFAVTLERIGQTLPIPDADRIEVAVLEGMDFQFVVPRGRYQPGDQVLYFPVDSLLPPALIERLGLTGRLAGRDQDRVKTIRLRGQISQGIVADLDLVPAGLTDPEAITAHLGVRKYDPPEQVTNDAILARLPEGQSAYDIEGADRYVQIAALLLDQPVWISEKVEGSNLWVRATPDGEVEVGQRNHALIPREGALHTFHKIVARQRIDAFAAALARAAGQPALVYGEALGPGIQGNIYQLKEHRALLFDARVGPEWLSPAGLREALQGFFGEEGDALLVPTLCFDRTLRDWLGGQSIKQASDGPSRLAGRAREGVVIKPMTEAVVRDFGRLVIKQRSPAYLAKSEY